MKNKFFDKAVNYFKEIRAETNKVTWPSRKYVVAATAIVLGLVAALSVFLMFLDFVLAKIMFFLDKVF